MDEPELVIPIKHAYKRDSLRFGDKFFLYAQFMEQEHWDEYGFCNPIYNSVMGYLPFGGYLVFPQKSDLLSACLPGLVVDCTNFDEKHAFTSIVHAVLTPFSDKELIDVTELLSLQYPYLSGSKVWMPV